MFGIIINRMGRKLRDYIVIWNSGVSFIYLVVGTIAVLYGIDSLHLTGDFSNIMNIIKTRFTSLTTEEIILMVVFGVIWIAGISNFFYVRRCLLEYKLKSFMAFLAGFTLVLADAMAITYLFYDVAINNGNFVLNPRTEFFNSLTWVGWSAVGVAILSGLFSLVGVVIIFKNAFKPVAVAENEFEKKERIEKEKQKEKLKKEHEKERKKSTAMPVRARASREKVSKSDMMFKSGDVSLEDEELAEQLAEKRKNPFLKEPTEEEAKAAKEAEKKKDTNANGVPLSVVKENAVLSSLPPSAATAAPSSLPAASPNISPNISSEADDGVIAPAVPPDGDGGAAPMGGGAIDPSELGLDDKPATPATPAA